MSDEWKLIIEGEEAYWYLEIGSSIITSNRFKIDLEEWKDERAYRKV